MTASQRFPKLTNIEWLVCVTSIFLLINTVPYFSQALELRWPWIGLGGIVFCAMMLSLRGEDQEFPFSTLTRFNWLLLAMYLAHQFEEHGVDMFGREYYFYEYANALLESRGVSLSQFSILKINTMLIWLAFLYAVWGGERYTWPGLAAAGMMLVNGLFHILGSVVTAEYNPGLLTSILLFLPVSLLYFRYARASSGISSKELVGGIVFGVFGHIMLPVIIVAAAPMWLLFPLAALPLIINIILRE